MEDIKQVAKAAKKRMKSNFWADCKRNIDENTKKKKNKGLNEFKVKTTLTDKVKNEIKGEKRDEFYLKVKELLDTEGEVSDAIGRLTEREVYDKLNYEEKQRYTLQLSAKYLAALNKYKQEKALEII